MKSYTTLKRELLRNKAVQKSYNDLGPEFLLIQEIIERRMKQGLTQAELARRIGTKQSSIARLESGTYNPTMKFLNRTAKALNGRLTVSIS